MKCCTGEPVEIYFFEGTGTRNDTIDKRWPDRQALDVPGHYRVPTGTLIVNGFEVRFIPTSPRVEAVEKIGAFIGAADDLLAFWQGIGGHYENVGDELLMDGYPTCLPSFDEFIEQLRHWQDRVRGDD